MSLSAILGDARNFVPLPQAAWGVLIYDYTVSLALFDYLPVLVAGVGLHLVCRYALNAGFENRWTIIIPLLAVTGGMLKASWKLNVAVTGNDIAWMSDSLFFFIAASYLLLAVGVIRGLRARATGATLPVCWWRWPFVVVVLVTLVALGLKISSPERHWSLLLLIVMSTSNLVFSIRLIAHSVALRQWVAVAGFGLNLVLTYVLVGLARIPEQTVQLQWIEEFTNLFSNSFLAVAAYSLVRQEKGENNNV